MPSCPKTSRKGWPRTRRCPNGDGEPPHLLGRHVAHCPHHHTRLGMTRGGRRARLLAWENRLHPLRQPKVENRDVAVLRDEDVLGLQVAVDDAFLVSRRAVSYTHLRAHETVLDLVCRL